MSRFTNILIVGGNSRAAKAFRKALSKNRTVSVTTLVRYATEPMGTENIICVDDYFDLSPEILRHQAYIIIFVGSSRGRPEDLLYVNAIGPAQLAVAGRDAGCKGLFYISSLSVYGGAEYIDRETPVSPCTVYGKSKLFGEQMLQAIATEAFSVSILRVPILYDSDSRTKLHSISDFLKKTKFFVLPDKTVERSMLHTRNLAAALERLISQPRSQVCFVADPVQFSFLRLAKAIYLYCESQVQILTLPKIIFLPIKLLAPSVYSSLYQNCVIADEAIEPFVARVDPEECMRALVQTR